MLKRKQRSDKIKISSKDLKQIEAMAGLGFNQKQICAVLGISEDTLRRRIKEGNQTLSAVISKGKTEALSKVAKKAYTLAISGNTSMIKYFLNCQGGWNEKSQLNEIQPDPRDEREKEIEEMIGEMTKEELDQYEKMITAQIAFESSVKERMKKDS